MDGYNTHSHSHSKTFSQKAYNGSNGFFTAYDDVFGGPPKFIINGGGGVTAFAPRAEDYSEIFGTFHSSSSSRISSIPILDLPPVDDSIASFDVSSSKFDYGEVFRGFEFVEIGVPFDELFRQSDGGDYPSEEAWTPVGVESLSDESDPSACSDKNKCFLKGDFDEPLDCKRFHMNCHKANQGTIEDISNMVQVAQINAVPGYTYLVDEASSLQKSANERFFADSVGNIVSGEDSSEDIAREKHLKKSANERFFADSVGNIVSGEDSSEDIAREKHLKKTLSHPAHAGSGMTSFENAHRPAIDHGNEGSHLDLGFISITETSLITEPSHLAPPSGAPILIDMKQGSTRSSSDHKSSKGYASESTFDGNLPPFFDVEVDASSSAAASAAAMKDAMSKAQAKLKSAKELMDRKKDGLQNRKKQSMKKEIDEGMSRMVSDELALEDDKIQGIHENEHNKRKAADERKSRVVFDECNIKKENIEAPSRMLFDNQAMDDNMAFERAHNQRKKNGVGKSRKVSDKYTSKKGNIEAKPIMVSDECIVENNGLQTTCEKEANKRTNSQKGSEAVLTAPQDLRNLADVEESSTVDAEPAWRKHRRNHSISAEAAGEWKEASEYFELVNSDISTTSFEASTDTKNLVPQRNEHHLGKRDGPSDIHQVLEQHDLALNSAMSSCKLDENEQESETVSDACQPEVNRWRLKATKAVSRNEYHAKMAKVAQEVHEREIYYHAGVVDQLKETWESSDQIRKPEVTLGPEMNGRIHNKTAQNVSGNVREQKVASVPLESGRTAKAVEQEEYTKKVKEASQTENGDIKATRESCGRGESQKRRKEALEEKGNQQIIEETCEKEENHIKMQEIQDHQEEYERFGKAEWENGMSWREFISDKNVGGGKSGVCEGDIDAKNAFEAEERCESDNTFGHAVGMEGYEKIPREAAEPNQKRLDETCKAVTSKESKEIESNDSEAISNVFLEQGESPKKFVQADRLNETQQGKKNVAEEELMTMYDRAGKFDMEVMDEEPGCLQGLGVRMNAEHLKASHGALDVDDVEQNFVPRFGKPCSVAEACKEAHGHEDEYRNRTEPLDAVKNEGPSGVGEDEDDLSQSESFAGVGSEPPSTSSDSTRSSDVCDGSRQTSLDDHKVLGPRCEKDLDHEHVGRTNDGEGQGSSVREHGSSRSVPTEKASNGWAETVKSAEVRQPVMSERKESFQKRSHPQKMCLNSERRGKSNSESPASEEKDKDDRLSREMELEKEHLRKLEEEREREREREKDRMAYAEARERTERASVEKAAAEARQRAMTEARERLEKACAEARGKSFDKTSAEARMRAERAAVERATAEARERAREKAMADRAVFESRERLERSSSEKFPSSYRDLGVRQNSFPSNTEKYDGLSDESAQRCRARLERHRRTVDRVARALAEKNMRDLIAQREQAERNRLAETLDADVKRWSSGKEGNLRALLSTLQYILGPESGWQPVPLTEVITSAAVKKAYRKATLCVHPDKLQQRGASIQQKYICEKVFDLLKAAWNKFNSEEQ